MLESTVLNVHRTHMSASAIITGLNGAVRIARSNEFFVMAAASCVAACTAIVTQTERIIFPAS
jgi:hypothetical protein